jgi:hypothetical protein
MDINQILSEFLAKNFLSLAVKVFGVVTALIYLFFAAVMIKQVQVMKKAVEIQDKGVLSLVAFIQLILAIILLIYSFFIL